MAEAEQAGGRLSHGFARRLSIRIGSVTARIEFLLAEPTLTTADGKWNNDPITNRKVFDLGAEFDHLAHILMTENVSVFHGGLIAVEEMKIGTADRAGRDFNDCVARMLNLGIRYSVNSHIPFTVPAKCSHCVSLSRFGYMFHLRALKRISCCGGGAAINRIIFNVAARPRAACGCCPRCLASPFRLPVSTAGCDDWRPRGHLVRNGRLPIGIHAAGVDLFVREQGIDTTTPGGRAVFQILAVFAEFERSIIQGTGAQVEAEGKHLGRPRIAS
jgi:hypothetical protein